MTVVMADRGRRDQQGRLVLMESAGRLGQLGRQDRQENRDRKATMDDQPTKLPFKPGSLVVSPIGLPALLGREARKVNKVLQESVVNEASAANEANQVRHQSLSPGERSLRVMVKDWLKACLSFLLTVLGLLGLYVLLEMLVQG